MAEADLFLIISQNNAKRTIKIKQASDALASALGYMRSELEGQLLLDFLGSRAAEALEDFMEYESDSDDVDRVLGRVSLFTLRNQKGEELAFAHKIYRETPKDDNHWFTLYLKDERRQIQERSLQTMLRENLAGVLSLDEGTGLADRRSCERYLEQVNAYVQSGHTKACFAVIRLDRFEKSCAKFGRTQCEKLVQHVASTCKTKFREEDLVSRIGEDKIGLLLMETTIDTARVILNRLRWFIASHRIMFAEKPNFSVTISVAFAPVIPDAEPAVMARCEGAIAALSQDERSQLLEA